MIQSALSIRNVQDSKLSSSSESRRKIMWVFKISLRIGHQSFQIVVVYLQKTASHAVAARCSWGSRRNITLVINCSSTWHLRHLAFTFDEITVGIHRWNSWACLSEAQTKTQISCTESLNQLRISSLLKFCFMFRRFKWIFEKVHRSRFGASSLLLPFCSKGSI